MVAREESIVGQAEVSVGVPADQKSIVLSKRKNAASVRAGGDFQVDLHYGSDSVLTGLQENHGNHENPESCLTELAIDHEIIERHFVDVACVESGAATPVVCGVGDFRQILTVRVKR